MKRGKGEQESISGIMTLALFRERAVRVCVCECESVCFLIY